MTYIRKLIHKDVLDWVAKQKITEGIGMEEKELFLHDFEKMLRNLIRPDKEDILQWLHDYETKHGQYINENTRLMRETLFELSNKLLAGHFDEVISYLMPRPPN